MILSQVSVSFRDLKDCKLLAGVLRLEKKEPRLVVFIIIPIGWVLFEGRNLRIPSTLQGAQHTSNA